MNLGYAYLAYWGTFVVVLWVGPGLLAAVGPKEERRTHRHVWSLRFVPGYGYLEECRCGERRPTWMGRRA